MKLIINLFHVFPGFEICILIFMLGILVGGIAWPLVTIFIARRFDPQFKDRTISFYILGSSRMMRSSWYASVMLYPQWLRMRPNTLPYTVFKGYNLWQNATFFERVLACAYLIPGMIAIFAVIIYYIHHYIFNNLLH